MKSGDATYVVRNAGVVNGMGDSDKLDADAGDNGFANADEGAGWCCW